MTASDMDNDDPQLHAALDAMRTELARRPAEHVAQRHLSAMRAGAADRASGPWTGLAERRTLWRNPMPVFTARTSAVGAALAMAFVLGLAAAGTLPDSAQNVVADTVSKVGLDLPNADDARGGGQGGKTGAGHGSDDADDGTDGSADTDKPDNHGRTVSSVAHDDSLEGCEHGQAVSDVASSKNDASGDGPDDGSGPGADRNPCDQGGGSEGGDESGPENSQGGNSGQGNANGGGGGGDHEGDAPGSSGAAGSNAGGNPAHGPDDDNPSADRPGHGAGGGGDGDSGDDED